MNLQKDKINFVETIPTIINVSRIEELQTAYDEKSYVIYTTYKSNFRISETLHKIILVIDGEKNLNQIVDHLATEEDFDLDADMLYDILVKFLFTKNLVSFNINNPIRDIHQKERKKPRSIKIFPHSVQMWLSKLFSPLISLELLILFIAIILALGYLIPKPEDVKTMEDFNGFLIYFFFFSGSMIHELGHSSAMIRGKKEPGSITIRFLFIFPVFATDVNNAWTMDKKERIQLDLAGVGLQALYLSILSILYLLFRFDTLYHIFFVSSAALLFNLIPFPLFDGYWLLSDMLGIPNLRKESLELVKRIFTRKKLENKGKWGKLPKLHKIVLFLYGFFSIFTFGLLFFYLNDVIRQLITLMLNFPETVAKLSLLLEQGQIFKFINDVFNIFLFFAMVFVLILQIYRKIKSLVKSKKH